MKIWNYQIELFEDVCEALEKQFKSFIICCLKLTYFSKCLQLLHFINIIFMKYFILISKRKAFTIFHRDIFAWLIIHYGCLNKNYISYFQMYANLYLNTNFKFCLIILSVLYILDFVENRKLSCNLYFKLIFVNIFLRIFCLNKTR